MMKAELEEALGSCVQRGVESLCGHPGVRGQDPGLGELSVGGRGRNRHREVAWDSLGRVR